MTDRHDYLRRLDANYYRGEACVHWSMTMEDRAVGWLTPEFHLRFRELLTHALFRYSLSCPIYCCMPDHVHLLWIGFRKSSDQLKAIKFFRKHLNVLLEQANRRLQMQPYDHVLRDEERQQSAFEAVAEYIARNPERKGLVAAEGFRDYPYSGCLVPGYPELTLRQPGYWSRFWRTYSFLRRAAHGTVAEVARLQHSDNHGEG